MIEKVLDLLFRSEISVEDNQIKRGAGWDGYINSLIAYSGMTHSDGRIFFI